MREGVQLQEVHSVEYQIVEYDEDDSDKDIASSTRLLDGSSHALAHPSSRFSVVLSHLNRKQIIILSAACTTILGGLMLHLYTALPAQTPLVVGPRLYPFTQPPGRGCSSTQFLNSLSRATIKEDGPSRAIDRSNRTDNTLPPFRYSFDLPNCPPPHVYPTAEACDLLNAFGGIFIQGDSLTRHVMNSLLMLLRNRLDGALLDDARRVGECFYESMFFEGRRCYQNYQPDSQKTNPMTCDGNIHLFHILTYSYEGMAGYEAWWSGLPAQKRQYSPVFLDAYGLHFHLSAALVLPMLRTSISNLTTREPRPVNLWLGLHAPGEQHSERRGGVLELNRAIAEELATTSAGSIVDGAAKSMEFYNVTKGAESFDGEHYSYQVNMEKAQIFLNVLDLVWHEAVERNGLLI